MTRWGLVVFGVVMSIKLFRIRLFWNREEGLCVEHRTEGTGRNAADHLAGTYVARDDCIGSDLRARADGQVPVSPAHDHRSRADNGVVADDDLMLRADPGLCSQGDPMIDFDAVADF